MAYQPSKRSSRTIEPLEINIFPMMNLMVVLVPLLLSTATAVKIGVIDLNLPQAVGSSVTEAGVPKEPQQSLDLTVTITQDGFYISSSQAILTQPESGGPTIPRLPDGSFDFETLNKKLLEVKEKIIGTNLETKRIILQAEPSIEYQTLVDTMDAARDTEIDGNKVELFPDVIISAGIV